MAMALAQYEDLFKLVSGYLYWRKNGFPNLVYCDLCPCVYSLRGMCYREWEPYICRAQKPSGSNLLDEPLKGFIVYPVCSP